MPGSGRVFPCLRKYVSRYTLIKGIYMENINFQDLQPFIFIIAGLILIFLSVFKKSNNESLKTTGEKAEGIIFKLDRNPTGSGEYSNVQDQVTIRFVTKDQRWITEPINQYFAVFYTKQYKEGQKVNVYYDPQDPLRFYIDSKQSVMIGRLVFASVGIVFSAIGFYQMFLE